MSATSDEINNLTISVDGDGKEADRNVIQTSDNCDNVPKSFALVVGENNSFKFPERNQAIILDSIDNTQKNDYIIGVGTLVEPTNVIFASRISNNRICIYLSSKEIVDKFMTKYGGITLNDKFIQARRLVSPAKRVILSNVSPSIPHNILEQELKRFGLQIVSPITFINAGVNLAEYRHILSFRRQVYVNLESIDKLPDSLVITCNKNTFRIFVSTDQIKCFVCKTVGHTASKCPTNTPTSILTTPTETQNNNLIDASKITVNVEVHKNTVGTEQTSAVPVEMSRADSKSVCSESHVISKKRIATSPLEVDRIDSINELQDQDADESDNFQLPDIRLSKPRLKKKKKELKIEDDTHLYPEFQSIFLTSKNVNYDKFCNFLTEAKGKQDVVSIAASLGLDAREIFDLMIESIRKVHTPSLKNRLKRIAKKFKNKYNFLTEPSIDISSSQDCLSDHTDM